MIPILSIVGKSDSGKTTLLEKVVRDLTSRGYRIATIKHDVHSFQIDHEGKDSWRHKQAGAVLTVISSPSQVALVADADHDHSLEEIRKKFVSGTDLIISEGFKREAHPKIEVYRSARSKDMICVADDNLVAVAGHPENPPEGIPIFDLDHVGPLCDFIERRFLQKG